MIAHFSGIAIWAVLLFALSVFPDLSTAFYFSIVAYTTLGFGDITLPEPWRITSGIMAANGFLMFGWSTAFQIDLLTELRRR